MSTDVGALRTPRRGAHPRMGQAIEVALVLAIGLATIGVLSTVTGSLRVTPSGRLVAIQARVDATSLAWRSYREIQGATVDARLLPAAPDVAASFEVPGPGAGPLEWRSFKEMTAGVALDRTTASFETPGPGEDPLAWRFSKEMAAGG